MVIVHTVCVHSRRARLREAQSRPTENGEHDAGYQTSAQLAPTQTAGR